MTKKITQAEIVMEYFKKNPNREIPHPEVVDWVVSEYKRRTGSIFRDPDRQIRKLSQENILQKIEKGVYLYDPDAAAKRELENFTKEQREIILARDGYRCVICGRGKKEGVELHVDHIKPKDKGGKATLENGQTLCAMHNFRKKNYKQTESGKKMFIRLYEQAKALGEKKTMAFCIDVLEDYEKHDINGHIIWEK